MSIFPLTKNNYLQNLLMPSKSTCSETEAQIFYSGQCFISIIVLFSIGFSRIIRFDTSRYQPLPPADRLTAFLLWVATGMAKSKYGKFSLSVFGLGANRQLFTLIHGEQLSTNHYKQKL